MAIDIQKIFEKVRDDVIYLNYIPNTLIKEEFLCEEFKVSRTPVREVISKLTLMGLLVVRPKKGTYVSRIDMSKIYDDLFIRGAIERQVLCEAINMATEEDIKELDSILDEQEIITNLEPSIQKAQLFHKNDDSFHKKFFMIAKHESLWELIKNTTTNLNRIRVMSNLRPKISVAETYNHHREMVNALREKNCEKLVKAFTDHLQLALIKFEDVRLQYSEYFKEN